MLSSPCEARIAGWRWRCPPGYRDCGFSVWSVGAQARGKQKLNSMKEGIRTPEACLPRERLVRDSLTNCPIFPQCGRSLDCMMRWLAPRALYRCHGGPSRDAVERQFDSSIVRFPPQIEVQALRVSRPSRTRTQGTRSCVLPYFPMRRPWVFGATSSSTGVRCIHVGEEPLEVRLKLPKCLSCDRHPWIGRDQVTCF